MITQLFRRQVPLLASVLLITAACASTGASSSSLPDWSDYAGRYEFAAVSEGQQLEGYLVIHSPEEFSVRYMLSPGKGNVCTRITEGGNVELGGRARVRGNRLTLTCRELYLVIRRDVDGLEGDASWPISDTSIEGEQCLVYVLDRRTGARRCAPRGDEEVKIYGGSLNLSRIADQE